MTESTEAADGVDMTTSSRDSHPERRAAFPSRLSRDHHAFDNCVASGRHKTRRKSLVNMRIDSRGLYRVHPQQDAQAAGGRRQVPGDIRGASSHHPRTGQVAENCIARGDVHDLTDRMLATSPPPVSRPLEGGSNCMRSGRISFGHAAPKI